jgi:hypothetical protein
MSSKAIIVMVIRKSMSGNCPHYYTPVCYQLSCFEQHDKDCSNKTYQVIVKKLENKSVLLQ